MQESLTVEQRRERIAAAREALAGIDASLWQVPSGGGLAALLGEVDALGSACESAKVEFVGEAMERGETGEGSAAMTVTQWVRHHAPSTRAGGAGQLVAVAQVYRKPAYAPIVQAIAAGVLPVRSAAMVLAEADRLRPLLVDGAEPHVLAGLITMAAQHGPRGCRMVRPALLAKYGQDGELQSQQDVARRFVSLSQPVEDGTGTAEYRLVLDVEGKAVLEAALGPLSTPKPVEGERDLRTSDQRRGEALVTLVRRAVASGESVGTNPKAQLIVTMDWESLASGVRGAGVTVGGSDTGTMLAPETVRRLACNASGRCRGAGRVGPHPRQLRPASRPPRRPGTSVTPPRTPPPPRRGHKHAHRSVPWGIRDGFVPREPDGRQRRRDIAPETGLLLCRGRP